MRTADGGFFVLLEFIVDESQDEGGLGGRWGQWCLIRVVLAGTYLSDRSFAEQDQLDAAAGFWSGVGHIWWNAVFWEG